MSQHDYVLSDAAGIAFLSDTNTALAAIVSNNSGPTVPATTYAYQWWADTTSGILKQRNAANTAWVNILDLATGSAINTPSGNIAATTVQAAINELDEEKASAAGGLAFRNRIINGGFTINQRGHTSGTALAAGAYGHDRFKAGAGGCTYTFTQGALGLNTTVTITAGTLVQIIEGCNVAEGGTYVLSWTGNAQGRLNGGVYGASGTVAVTGWTAGTNLPVEFSTGTVGSIQLEKGGIFTSFDCRDYGRELFMCQRYCYVGAVLIIGNTDSVGNPSVAGSVPVPLRATPTLVSYSGAWRGPLIVAITNLTINGMSGACVTFSSTHVGSANSLITVSQGVISISLSSEL